MLPNFYVSEYFHDKLATLVVPPTDGTASGTLTNSENSVQIDA